METEDNILRLGELFCGPGGLAVGALGARADGTPLRFVHQWATDYDRDTCDTYVRNLCPDAPHSVVCEDVRKLDVGRLEALGGIDCLAFGFPCNDFSVVGEQKGFDGSFGPLYSYGVKVLERFRPRCFVAENVGGLKSANDGTAIKTILDAMTAAGYKICPNLYKFEEYGVPQARHRIIIVGIRRDLPFDFKVPSPGPYKPMTCREAIEMPPIPADAANNEATRQSPVVVERLRHIRPGQNAFTADLPPQLQLKVKGAKISQIYKRLDPERAAYTVTGSGGGRDAHIPLERAPRPHQQGEGAAPDFPRRVRLLRQQRVCPQADRHGRPLPRGQGHFRGPAAYFRRHPLRVCRT